MAGDSDGAFTLVELLAVVAILAILAALFFPAAQYVMPRVDRAICMSKLRSLQANFSSYATEGWPQLPPGVPLGSMAEQKWWVEKTREDFGLSLKDWQCPTIARGMKALPERDRPLIHYLPTPFSGEPNRANKNLRMPWFIEIGNAHGEGNLLIRGNGAIEAAR